MKRNVLPLDNSLKAKLMKSQPRAADEPLWGPKDLAWYLGVSEKNARKMMAEVGSPGFRVGKLYRVLPDDARSFYSRGRQTCKEPLQ